MGKQSVRDTEKAQIARVCAKAMQDAGARAFVFLADWHGELQIAVGGDDDFSAFTCLLLGASEAMEQLFSRSPGLREKFDEILDKFEQTFGTAKGKMARALFTGTKAADPSFRPFTVDETETPLIDELTKRVKFPGS